MVAALPGMKLKFSNFPGRKKEKTENEMKWEGKRQDLKEIREEKGRKGMEPNGKKGRRERKRIEWSVTWER